MRYESEVDLRLYGSEQKASEYILEGRKVLGEVWNRDIVLGDLDQSWRRIELEDGTVTIAVYASRFTTPRIEIFATDAFPSAETPGQYLLQLAWYPEGLVFSPVSATLPDGVGLPTRDPITGDQLTVPTSTNVVFPQVLMNRYENNKYLDRGAFVSGTREGANGLSDEPPQLRVNTDDSFSESTTAFRYMYKLPRPLDYGTVAFTYDGSDFWADNANQAQFPTICGEYLITEQVVDGQVFNTAVLVREQKEAISGDDIIFEAESDTWYAHRPEEILYPTPAHEAIFLRCNEYRTALSAPPVHRQLRGDGNSSAAAVAEVAISGDLSHNSLDFRPGFRTADGKMLNATGVDEDAGENLLISATAVGTTEAVGNAVADFWRNSLGHYLNIVSVRWDNDQQIPGAQHQIAYAEGTADRTTEDIPNIADFPPNPVSGGIWSQTFTKREEWVKAWNHWYEGDFGLVGWEGTGRPQDNDFISFSSGEYQAYFGFRGCRFVLPNSDDEDEMVRVLGVAVYNRSGQLWFRVAVLTNTIGDETLPANDRIYKDGSIKIFRAPVGVTESNYKPRYGYYDPDPNREWELEDEILLPYAPVSGEGWLIPTFATAAISPDGTKFCFSYNKYRVDLQTVHYRSSSNFDFSPDVQRNFLVTWPVHIEKEVDGGFVQIDNGPPDVTVSSFNVRNQANNYRNHYTRTLQTVIDYLPYYDAQNTLQYVELDIDEYQTQEFTGHMWRVHKLRFASGKEVVINYQALENFTTPTTFSAFNSAHANFPLVDGEDEPFHTVIHHLDPAEEAVVYTKAMLRTEEKNPGTTWENWIQYGNTELVVDIGSGDDRITETIWRRVETSANPRAELSTAGFQASVVSSPVSAGVPWNFNGNVRELDLRTSYMIYNYKCPVALVQSTFFSAFDAAINGLPGAGWYDSSNQSSHVFFYGPYTGGGVNQYDGAAYGSYDTQGMYNKDNYSASLWQPPINALDMKENRFVFRQLFANQTAASYYTDNVSPLYSDVRFADVQLVSYNGRHLLRAAVSAAVGQLYVTGTDGLAGPFGSAAGTGDFSRLILPDRPDISEIVGTNTRLNDDSNVATIIWSNFDLDDVAEISDVTDIVPFGRAV